MYLSGVSAFGGPDVRNMVSYFQESILQGPKEIGCSAACGKFM